MRFCSSTYVVPADTEAGWSWATEAAPYEECYPSLSPRPPSYGCPGEP